MTNRFPALEILETRCLLSGAGMPPMMEPFGDFAHESDRGGHEMRGPGPDFGGRDGGREMPPPDFGAFSLPMQHGPERDFGGFAPPPRQPMLPPSSDLHAEGNEASGNTQLPFTPSDGRREPISSGATAGMTSVAAVSDGTLAKSTETISAVSALTIESQTQNARDVESSRDNTAVPKLQTKDLPAVKVPKCDLDGLIELTAEETSQRTKRKSAQATGPTQTADKLERLTTLPLGSRDEFRRLPQPEAASRDAFATWPASGPAWTPADAGLVEILAGDIVSDARQSSAESNAPSILRGSFPSGLEAEINLYQAFDLAPEQAVVPIASAAPPQSSPESTQ